MKFLCLFLVFGCSKAVPADSIDAPPVEVFELSDGDLLVVESRPFESMDAADTWHSDVAVHQDGTYTRNGETGTLPAELVADLRTFLTVGSTAQVSSPGDPSIQNCMAIPDQTFRVSSPAAGGGLMAQWNTPCGGPIPEYVSAWMNRIDLAINAAEAGGE
jgi:hypothetical protein